MTNPAEDATGFEQAQTALGEATKKTRWLNQMVSEGKLRLNPEAAEAAAKRCEKTADEVKEIQNDLQAASPINGLGDYLSSKDVAHHLEQKAVHPDSGGIALLEQLNGALLGEADAYRNAAKDYHVTDEQIADDFRKGQQ